MKYTAKTIKNWPTDCNVQNENNVWIPARPMGYNPRYYQVPKVLFEKLKLAWGVLTGKYDALDWEDS